MGTVTMWLTVKKGTFHTGQTLWVMTMDTAFAPREGDEVHLVYRDDPEYGGEWTVTQQVRRHYWDGDGTYHAEMRHMVVDPDEAYEAHLQRIPWDSRNREDVWRAERDGDLDALLRASGWITYEEWKAS